MGRPSPVAAPGAGGGGGGAAHARADLQTAPVGQSRHARRCHGANDWRGGGDPQYARRFSLAVAVDRPARGSRDSRGRACGAVRDAPGAARRPRPLPARARHRASPPDGGHRDICSAGSVFLPPGGVERPARADVIRCLVRPRRSAAGGGLSRYEPAVGQHCRGAREKNRSRESTRAPPHRARRTRTAQHGGPASGRHRGAEQFRWLPRHVSGFNSSRSTS